MKMMDMKQAPADTTDYPAPTEDAYPSGLCLYLNSETCEKLDLDEDCETGDIIVIRAIAKVTSKSDREIRGPDGNMKNDCRIELQMTHMAVVDEDDEEPGEE